MPKIDLTPCLDLPINQPVSTIDRHFLYSVNRGLLTISPTGGVGGGGIISIQELV